ncbi:GNAT family N-acetyltransferase [Flavobacterium sp. CYK-4]|uniref:GNAT family N-acetyltransferase n=1 Tax=Flavobacterium lotistagni TaxID=2709660 RepID=UPI0014094067|nr:GNAT family protein [Flavobacterium lotistagni]NHM07334.1 GNAT family N-acetyltransferase [Flavobacterium lotistagni]
MLTLRGESVHLRALEPEDLEFLYLIENDESIWEVSNTSTPYSKFLIRQYLKNAHQDIFEAKQLRLAIGKNGQRQPVGLIDLFDFDPKNARAGVGILVHDPENRNVGIGKEALGLLIQYAFRKLNLHQLYANIHSQNQPSLHLFTTFGFQKIGTKKQWNLVEGQYQDEEMFQLINHHQL